MPFDPQHLTPHISMNRVRIVDLPGIDLPDDIKGKTGHELLAADRVMRLVYLRKQALKLTLDRNAYLWPLLLDQSLLSDDAEVQAEAQSIARQLGHSLAYLLLTLKRGDPVNREAREEWDESYWEFWAQIETVWIGGGLVSGNLGRQMIAAARDLLQQTGTALQINSSPFGASLPLVGAARHAPDGCDRALIVDFGGSSIKRALALYSEHTLMVLRRLPPLSAYSPAMSEEKEGKDTRWTDDTWIATVTFDHMVQTLADALAETGSVCSTVFASVASYLEDGHPQDYQGGMYTRLRLINANLQSALAEAVSQRRSTPVSVRLIHDGTAAAAVYAGSPHTAVMTMGTALGIGFPPPSDQHLCKLSQDLE